MPMPGEKDPKEHPEEYIEHLQQSTLELQGQCFDLQEKLAQARKWQPWIDAILLAFGAGVIFGSWLMGYLLGEL